MVEKTEIERTQLIDLVRTLEMKLASAEQSSSEQLWMFRQKSATLDAERVSFEREKTFVREKQEAEEKRIKVVDCLIVNCHPIRKLIDFIDSICILRCWKKSNMQNISVSWTLLMRIASRFGAKRVNCRHWHDWSRQQIRRRSVKLS